MEINLDGSAIRRTARSFLEDADDLTAGNANEEAILETDQRVLASGDGVEIYKAKNYISGNFGYYKNRKDAVDFVGLKGNAVGPTLSDTLNKAFPGKGGQPIWWDPSETKHKIPRDGDWVGVDDIY